MAGGGEKRQGAVLNVGAVTMQLAIVIGATGAVTSSKGFGATGVARASAGVYTVTLDRKWARLQGFCGSVQQAGAVAPLTARLKATYAAATTLQFEICNTTGVATDPASGDVVYVAVTFDDSNGML